LLSYNEDEIASKRKLEELNKGIRERNSSNNKYINEKSRKMAIDAITRNVSNYATNDDSIEEKPANLHSKLKIHNIKMPHAVVFSSVHQNTL
jgi:hypothetical protein